METGRLLGLEIVELQLGVFGIPADGSEQSIAQFSLAYTDSHTQKMMTCCSRLETNKIKNKSGIKRIKKVNCLLIRPDSKH